MPRDSDQHAPSREEATADRDQAQADADQRTLNRDQAAVDRDGTAADRAAATHDREQAAADRDQAQADADQRTLNRDQAAADREQAAADRDQAQADADLRTCNRDQAATDRAGAAADRAAASRDREQAAADRAAASHEREQARAELLHTQLDQLTGAFGRELGMVLLEREMNRARRGNGRLVLAYVDLDGLKQVNDGHGHAAGDAVLRDVVAAIQTQLRSYDPIVRVGGDEFVCALSDCTPDDAHRRFQDIRAAMEQTQPTASISVGFAALRPEDTLDQLTERSDRALYEMKDTR